MALEAVATAQYEGLLTPLKAYHSLLRQSVDAPATKADDPLGIVWLRTKSERRISRKVLNGLELFALLAQVDWNVWKELAKEIWEGRKLEDFGGNSARVGVDLDPHVEGRVELVFEVFATSAQAHAQTPDVVKAREVVKQILQNRGEVLTEVPVRVTVEGHGSPTNIVFKVLQIVATQRLLDDLDAQKDRYHGLRIRFFYPGLSSVALGATDLQQFAAIAAAGVAIDAFGTIKPEVHLQHPEIFAKSLWTLCAIGATDPLARERGVKKVALTKEFRASMIPSIYSAICASPSVHTIIIDTAIDAKTPKKYCQQVWPWIGFTSFCQAPNNIQELRVLSMNVKNLDVADVQVMRDVISASDPITKLYPRSASLATEAISSARFFLNDPTKNHGVDSVTVESPAVLTDLPVLKKSKEWTTVLLPAWGQAWVHGDDIVAKQRWVKGSFSVKSIARLEFSNLQNESKDAVIALLRLVGAGVKQLVVSATRTPPLSSCDDWLTQALAACPNLEVLKLTWIPIGSLQFLLDAYESGKCRLTRFKTTGDAIMGCDESLRRLFVALGDRTHPSARHLSDFECSPIKIATISDPDMVATAVRMLKTNERLRDLKFALLSPDTNAREFDKIVEPLNAFDKKQISSPLAPLDVRQRIAFLSVVTPYQAPKSRGKHKHQHKQHPRAVEKLDACVLSLIFEMAAKCCERRVRLTPYRGW